MHAGRDKANQKTGTYLNQVAGRANEHRHDDRDGVHRQRRRVTVALLPPPMVALIASIGVFMSMAHTPAKG